MAVQVEVFVEEQPQRQNHQRQRRHPGPVHPAHEKVADQQRARWGRQEGSGETLDCARGWPQRQLAAAHTARRRNRASSFSKVSGSAASNTSRSPLIGWSSPSCTACSI